MCQRLPPLSELGILAGQMNKDSCLLIARKSRQVVFGEPHYRSVFDQIEFPFEFDKRAVETIFRVRVNTDKSCFFGLRTGTETISSLATGCSK